MSLKTKIISGYFLIILLAALFSVIAINNYTKVTGLYEEINTKYYHIVKIAQELTYRILERQAGIRGFLLTGKTRYLVTYDENILPIKSLLRKAKELQQGDEKYLRVINRYEELVKDWENKTAEVKKELRQKLDYGVIDYPEYITSIANIDKTGRSILRGLKAVNNQLIHIAENDMSYRSAMALKVGRSAKRLLITVAISSLLVGAIFGYFISNHITRPLEDVVKAASIIASGDLSHRIPIKRRDELGILGNSFNQMVERLDKSIQTLKESEEKYSTLVENANDGIIIIQNMKYVFVNKKFSEITGYSVDELIGMNFFQILPSDTLEFVKKMHKERMKGRDVPSIYETKIKDKKGEIKYVEVNAGLIEFKGENADLVVFRDITDRKGYEKDLKDLSEQLINAQEEERRRISQELHDEIGQALSAINISLETLENESDFNEVAIKKKLSDISVLVEKTIDDTHRISYDLRPYLLDDFGLVSALRWYAENFQERMGIEISFQTQGAEQKLSPAMETLIYRITQEALTNILKHAEAKKIGILLSFHEELIDLTVKDNGKGFNIEKVQRSHQYDKGGLGLFGIRERLAPYNGTLSIESSKGEGTKLIVQIPAGLSNA